MNDWALGAIFLVGVCVAVAIAAREPGAPQISDTEASMSGGMIAFHQPGKRTIYVRPEAIQAFVLWPMHHSVDNPAIGIIVGAHEYRLDCKSLEKAKEIETFLLEHLKE